MPKNYQELLLAMYVQNEKYHDTKERVLWLAGTIYYGFSVLILRWLLDAPNDWFGDNPLLVGDCVVPIQGIMAVFLSLVFVLVLWYLWFQHKAKLGTIDTFNRLGTLIRELGNDFDNLMGFPPKKNKDVPFFRRKEVPGRIVIFVAALFFFAQLIVLSGKG